MTVRLLALGVCGLLLEIGWLAVSSLSVVLSHSALFTAAFLEAHPPARQLLNFTLGATRGIAGLAEAPIAQPLGAPAYLAPVTTLAAVMLWLAVAYLMALVLLERGVGARPAAAWIVVCSALLFQATCLFVPGLFSQDVFSYIAYGRLAAVYDLNPYVWPPSVIPRDAVFPWVAEVWRAYASPYGPLWVDLQAAMARATSGLSIADQALAYRALANMLLVANLGLLWVLLGRMTRLDRAQRTTALAALAWNPLVLFEVAANAHNDPLMVSFTLLALVLFTRSSNGVIASASFTLGALVKYLSGLGLVWVYVAAAARSFKGVTPQIPETAYVDDSAQIIGDVILGEHASIWMNAVLRGDVHVIRVGHYSNIQDCSVLHGMKEKYGVFLGDYVTVGHSAILHGCTIEDRCLIGMGSIILNGAHVGAGSIIAAGTLIAEKTKVEPNSLWMGSPGKFRRHLDEKDQEMILMYAENYLGYKKSYLAERK